MDFLAELFEQLTVVRATGALGVHGGDGGGQLLLHARDLGGEVAAVLGLEAALEAEVGGQSVVQAHERALVGRAQLLLDLAYLQRLALHHVEVGSEVVEAVVAQAGTLDAFALELQFAQQFGVVDEEDGARVGELGVAENFEEPLGGLELRGALAELIPLALGERALQRFPFSPSAVRAVAFERHVGVAADDDEAVAGDRVEGLDAAVDEDGQLGPLADLEGVGLVRPRLERVGGLEGEEGDKEPGPVLFHTGNGFATKRRKEAQKGEGEEMRIPSPPSGERVRVRGRAEAGDGVAGSRRLRKGWLSSVRPRSAGRRSPSPRPSPPVGAREKKRGVLNTPAEH